MEDKVTKGINMMAVIQGGFKLPIVRFIHEHKLASIEQIAVGAEMKTVTVNTGVSKLVNVGVLKKFKKGHNSFFYISPNFADYLQAVIKYFSIDFCPEKDMGRLLNEAVESVEQKIIERTKKATKTRSENYLNRLKAEKNKFEQLDLFVPENK